ncbi:RNA methyltransferase [Spirochaetia bacterium]|nr:RNA methyltransferase [Spirochaetia bacterium]
MGRIPKALKPGHMQEFTAAVLCAAGAEKVVSNELKKCIPPESGNRKGNLSFLESGYGRVRFKTDLAGLYRALLSLRAADRLLLEAGAFPAADFDALFEGTAQIPWEHFVPRGLGLTVSKVRSNRSQLRAETSIQAMVHKAAAKRLCDKYGMNRLPDPGPDGREAELRVYLEKDEALVYLDLSGSPLFKRGYRPTGGMAPLRESTAAAIILLSGWRRKFPLYDPLCGSGTIVIEAAMYAWDMAPGLGRNFALSALAFGDRQLEETIRRELAEKVDFTRRFRICGSDADEKAISLAQANLRRALSLAGPAAGKSGDTAGIDLRVLPMEKANADFFAGPSAQNEPGFIITNPPYGKRLGDPAEAEARYREMSRLGTAFPGWKLALITDHAGFESHFGKKADSCRELKSGAVDAYLYQYEKL